jgi:mono/diheme cytochrome c family protein
MTTFKSRIFLVTAFAAAGGIVEAETLSYDLPDETVIFRPGPGADVAQNNCMACHSVDYIQMQPPNKGKAFWEAEVTKMINAYRAPIAEADAKAIVDYLSHAY